VASARPELVPERVVRGALPPHPARPPEYWLVEPVVPDAPELRDPTSEPVRADGVRVATPVPPIVRRRRS
jgi:hypothetical protein